MTEQSVSAAGELQWLDGGNRHDHETWLYVWRSTQARRPHDHPAYLQAMAVAGNRPAAVSYRHPSGARVFYPFYCQPLDSLPFFSESGVDALHLVSPYGYGGPLYEGPPELRPSVSSDFEALFNAKAARRGVVSEFVREDLFHGRLADRCAGEAIEQQPNVVVRLQRTPEEVWRTYQSKVRKNVNRARQQGLRVVFDAAGTYLDRFLAVYHETMRRNGAAGYFFMEKPIFELLGETLGSDGGLAYVHVFDGDNIVSTELLLLSTDTIYSFLGGTVASAFDKRPNDLLKHEVISWGAARGFRFYVLGGGISPGDGTFLYKKAFDPGGIIPFVVRRIRHNPELYQRLVFLRTRFEKTRGREWSPREDFFPAYLS